MKNRDRKNGGLQIVKQTNRSHAKTLQNNESGRKGDLDAFALLYTEMV